VADNANPGYHAQDIPGDHGLISNDINSVFEDMNQNERYCPGSNRTYDRKHEQGLKTLPSPGFTRSLMMAVIQSWLSSRIT
jgi:hypothetical protein